MPRATRTKVEQRDAEALVKTVRNQIEGYWETTRALRLLMREDQKLIVGGEGQWLPEDVQKLKYENRPVLSFNVLFGLVNFLAGYEIERAQDFRYFPRGVEDEAIGRYATSLAKYALDLMDGRSQMNRGFRGGLITGVAALEVNHQTELTDDVVEGEIGLDLLDTLAVYFDPYARRYDRNDGRFMGKLLWMTPEEAQRRWPQHKAKLTADIGKHFSVQEPDTRSDEWQLAATIEGLFWKRAQLVKDRQR